MFCLVEPFVFQNPEEEYDGELDEELARDMSKRLKGMEVGARVGVKFEGELPDGELVDTWEPGIVRKYDGSRYVSFLEDGGELHKKIDLHEYTWKYLK